MRNAIIAVIVSAKIYTKNGDRGSSKAMSGKQTPKDDLSFIVLGDIDELNASLGVVSAFSKTSLKKSISQIQSDLFSIGAFLAGYKSDSVLSNYLADRVHEIEVTIDLIDGKNTKLRNFILPGGTHESAHLHLARAICRRAERSLVRYSNSSKNNSRKWDKEGMIQLLKYINRLSDYLFVLARYCNKKGKKDIVWQGLPAKIQ